ncbi:MAG: InlB B-repeat-containing protein [Tannerellaceae bacterium]|jgi:uncharacterized repeat protein (TIGR02543 family)|nr:InlB B-repeat-containing protein [Tannerellaceae bacterium]
MKTQLNLFVALLLLTATFASCEKDDGEPDTSYTVTFNPDGGAPTPQPQTVKAGEKAVAPADNPAKKGYVFMFWQLSGSVTAYNFSTPVNSDITLQARWEEETNVAYWQVTWELNGGTWPADDNHATQAAKGGTLAEPAAPTKTGSTFGGWYKEAALNTPINFPYDISGITADLTLYAKWTGNEEPPVSSGTIRLASGQYNYFALYPNGSLYASGRNKYGQLGSGNTTDIETLTQVATGVSAVSARGNSSLMLKKDGSVLGAGLNGSGQLGLGNTNAYAVFTVLPVDNVKAIAAGDNHTLILKNNGSVWSAGWNSAGQLGTGDDTDKTTFAATNLTADVASIISGSHVSFALKNDGTVWGSGSNYDCALGNQFSYSYIRAFINIFSGAKAIAVGDAHSLILANDGTVHASGVNKKGQLGIGSVEIAEGFTRATDNSGGALSNVTAIAAGKFHSLVLKADGTLWTTGDNMYGQLGTGNETDYNRFTQVATDVETMSAGEFHTVFVKKDGSIHTFGKVNPYDALNGSSKIIIKTKDNTYGQYITRVNLMDSKFTDIFSYSENITSAHPGCEISIKPGTYNLKFHVSNLSVTSEFPNLTVADNETVTITYEYVSTGFGKYQWTVTRSK